MSKSLLEIENPVIALFHGNKWTPFASILLFGVIWEVAVRLSGVHALLMPAPSAVLVRLFEMMGPGKGATPDFLMLRHIGMTMLALLAGFFPCGDGLLRHWPDHGNEPRLVCLA